MSTCPTTAVTTPEQARILRPNAGPQETFLSTRADIALYGGTAGAGKSFATVLDPLRHVHRPGFTAIVLRREATRLVGGGSLWSESQGVYPSTGAKSRESPALEWTWPSGARLEMRHLQYEKDVHAHQGKQYAAIYFDEVCEFSGPQFWFMLSRLRTTCGIRPYVRATCNPDPDSFVRKLIDWWIGPEGLPIRERSGVLRWFVRDGDDLVWFDTRDQAMARFQDREPMSLTFIAASLSDNPQGDPTYGDRLRMLPRVERERLLYGNWDVRALAGDYFKRRWWRIAEPHDDVVSSVTRWVRGWDLAATEATESNRDPDWTAGVKAGITRGGSLVIADVERFRGTPGAVEQALLRIAEQDGRNCTVGLWQDPGQAGKAQVAHLASLCRSRGFALDSETATQNKEAYAKIWSPHVERGEVYLVRGPWNDALINEAEAFPGPGHDDQVDAASRAMTMLLHGAAPVRSFRIKDL